MKRSGSIIQYMIECKTQKWKPFPFTEEVSYNYCVTMKAQGAKPSKGDSFRAAVNFCGFVLRFDGFKTVQESI